MVSPGSLHAPLFSLITPTMRKKLKLAFSKNNVKKEKNFILQK